MSQYGNYQSALQDKYLNLYLIGYGLAEITMIKSLDLELAVMQKWANRIISTKNIFRRYRLKRIFTKMIKKRYGKSN